MQDFLKEKCNILSFSDPERYGCQFLPAIITGSLNGFPTGYPPVLNFAPV